MVDNKNNTGFEIISDKQIPNPNTSKSNSNQFNPHSYYVVQSNKLTQALTEQNTREELIRHSLKLIDNRSNELSMSKTIQSLASSLYYNYFQLNTKFSLENNNSYQLYLFNKPIFTKKEFDNALLCLIYISYRNNINPIFTTSSSNSFMTSDCGWGCMIRCSQMLLAKGLFELKLSKLKANVNQGFQYNAIKKIRDELLYLFNDNTIPIECVISLDDYSYFIQGIEGLAQKNSQYNCIKEITAPFSIQTICRLTKNAGQWTSGIRMINTFIDINKYLFNKVKLVHYVNSAIKEIELYKAFCTEMSCFCDINALQPGISLCKKCFCSLPPNDDDIFIYQGNAYKYNSIGGIIFVSLRLGLNEIEKEYIKNVKALFSLKNNIGIVGGKEERAYYFIGYIGSQFLFLDPHLNQPVMDISTNDTSSYLVKDIYQLNPNDMSPELTVGFCIKSPNDLREFIKEIKSQKNFIITIK